MQSVMASIWNMLHQKANMPFFQNNLRESIEAVLVIFLMLQLVKSLNLVLIQQGLQVEAYWLT